jgi:hypothetical protein
MNRINMTDFAKVFNIYSIESAQDDDDSNTEQIKRANASKNIFNDSSFDENSFFLIIRY